MKYVTLDDLKKGDRFWYKNSECIRIDTILGWKPGTDVENPTLFTAFNADDAEIIDVPLFQKVEVEQ